MRNELSKLKEQTQKSEIIKNSAKFKAQGESSKENARKWVIAIISAISLFVGVLLWGLSSNEELFNIAANILEKSKGLNAEFINKLILIEVAKKIGTKTLIYSMFIYFITFLVKNYNAQMHNYIVNSHKSNALSSTVDLIGTARENEGNDKIILQATQAIFATHKSGYQGVENEPNSPNLITNVIDSFSSKK
ncbi:hypothetical protein [Hymenobacter lapidiphilus]|uniref:Uncharacterized protein n=1 Tax=Hymenobacter lapidiphilus TaxID=2608003 RepID=A0A7Y7U5D4_9BACT|nr:hypothetical protein [Hymenobacter lapidiphilus]NVO31348.1 hypothetical protein [Hymenobacter lapidiphilus]